MYKDEVYSCPRLRLYLTIAKKHSKDNFKRKVNESTSYINWSIYKHIIQGRCSIYSGWSHNLRKSMLKSTLLVQ